MLRKHHLLCLLIGAPFALALACDTVRDVRDLTNILNALDPDEVEVDIFNDSDIAANIMGPGETASPDNLVPPGGGRLVIVRFVANGNVTFTAISVQGHFSQATWKFTDKLTHEGGVKKNGEVTYTAENILTCKGDLFAEN
jgi:hypothetical protein